MRILYIATLLLLPTYSYAYPIDASLGFGLGYTWSESVFNDPIREINNATETPTYSSVKNSGQPFNLYTTFRFHKYYGFEMGYLNYGEIKFNKSLIITDNNDASLIESRIRQANITQTGFYLSHVIFFPISESVILQAKAGAIFGNAQYNDDETITTQSLEEGQPPPPVINAYNNSSESFAKAHLATAIVYRNNRSSAWRLQLSQLQNSHLAEKESFTQWFTQLSYEVKL